MPSPQATNVDPVLTGLSIDYKNQLYIAKRLFPQIGNIPPAGQYPKFKKKPNFSLSDDTLTAQGKAREVDFDVEWLSYSVTPHAKKKPVSEISKKWAAQGGRALDLERKATTFVKDQLLLMFESRAATLATTAGTYDSSHRVTLSGDSQWDSGAEASTPVADLKAGVQACAVRPNLCIIGQEVFDVVSEDAAIQDKIKYSQLGVATPDLLAQIIGVKEVIVAAAQYESSGDYPYIWGKNVVLAYVEANPDIDIVTYGATFSPDGGDFVRVYRDEATGGGSNVIEAEWDYQLAVICADCGFLIKDAIAG